MGTYCKNHVLEEINTAAVQTKDGKVTLKPTKEGSCIHMGGCNTAHDDLYQLEYVYQPSKESKKAAKGTTAEEKPTEEAPTTS